MSYLPFALLAYLLNSIAVLIDKFQLSKTIRNPFVYVFYISALSLLALVVLPLAQMPSWQALGLASLSTILWTTGAYCMFCALRVGVASRVVPVIGTLIPVFLTIQAFFTGSISYNETWAVCLLILAIVLLTASSWRGSIKKEEVLFELGSGLLFAASYLSLREAYLISNFLSVFAYSRLILIPFVAAVMLLPNLRRLVLLRGGHKLGFSKTALFLFGQACGGASGLLLTFAISMATPALVNSLQGTQYLFLLFFSLILGRRFPQIFPENRTFWGALSKLLAIFFICLGLFTLAASSSPAPIPKLGVSFSPRYAASLGLDPQLVFTDLVKEVKVKHIRLPVYWDEVEKSPNQYDFSKVDYYIKQANQYGARVTIVVGYKQPRWPECFAPSWAKKLSEEELNLKIIQLVTTEVRHFLVSPAVESWQVENEPFFSFGICPKPNQETYQRVSREISTVQFLDKRPVIITDSGELSAWNKAMGLGSVFGTTMYRTVWNPYLGPLEYPMPPIFYQLKAMFIRALFGVNINSVIISELQAEPWIAGKVPTSQVDIKDQIKTFKVSQLQRNLDYAKETRFSAIYFWGAEWWYFARQRNWPQYLENAKVIFKESI